MELYGRPVKVLFIDAIGPISPMVDGKSYICHAECPVSRYALLKASETDTENEWAKFLIEGVFS